jgi:hypothetical protein
VETSYWETSSPFTSSRDVEKAEADTKAMSLGTEDGDHSASPKMTFEHISVLEEREPEKAQDKDMEGDETPGPRWTSHDLSLMSFRRTLCCPLPPMKRGWQRSKRPECP